MGERLREELGDRLSSVEVAGPGFLNLRLADGWYGEALRHVLDAGEHFGVREPRTGERAHVEFVSANPTGPLTVGQRAARRLRRRRRPAARARRLRGLARVLPQRRGVPGLNLGLSIQARARGEEPPEDGYQGDYVRALAAARSQAPPTRPAEGLAEQGVALMTEQIREALHDYGVDFDVWFSERTLHPEGIERALERVADHTYRHDGALWLRTTTWGDDKDRVLVRSTGEPTYFAADLAHHAWKVDRGFDAAGQRPGLRPSRLRRAHQGSGGGARRRPGRLECSSCSSCI